MTLAVGGINGTGAAEPWLPARVRPELGESFKSLCNRIARANDLHNQDLLNICKAKHPSARTQIQAVADSIGVEPARVEVLTLDSIGRAVRRSSTVWRLRTTLWVCPHDHCSGIEDTLRGFAIQFLCLRCNCFLVPADSRAEVVRADEAAVQVQWEILDSVAVKSNEQVRERLVRLRRCAASVGAVLLRNEFSEVAVLPDPDEVAHSGRSDCWRSSALGIPEIPELVGATLQSAWEFAASSHATYLVVNALGDDQLPDYKKWRLFSNRPTETPRGSLPTTEEPSESLIAAGLRIRQLVSDDGLSPEHVPSEVRFASDPMILSEDTWRWRRHVCTQLRLWLINLEIAGNVVAGHRGGRPISEAVHARQKELDVVWEWYELIVPHVAPVDAARYLSQIVELAEKVTGRRPEDRCDPRTPLSEKAFRNLVPSAAARPRADIEVARYWMWLDSVVGTDDYGYLPPCEPSTVAAFDRALRPEEKLALRQYNREQNEIRDDLLRRTNTRPADAWIVDLA